MSEVFGAAKAAPYGMAKATPYGMAKATPYGMAKATPYGMAKAAPYGMAKAAPYGMAKAAPCRKTSRGETALVFLLIVLLIAVPLLPPTGALVLALAVVALTALAWQRRAPAATSLGLLFGTCLVLGVAGVGPQQVTFALGLGIYAGVVQRVAWLRDSTKWLKRGVVSPGVAAFSAAIVVVSAISLLFWIQLAEPDLADLVRTFIPAWSLWLLIPGAVLLALINAAVEEAAYRGVVLGALDASLGPTALAVLLQAAAFGTLHFRGGFPRGIAGVVLTFIYGLALGTLRRKSAGLLAPWVTHVLTDIIIFAIVLIHLRG